MIAHAILKTRPERKRSLSDKLDIPDELIDVSIKVMEAFITLNNGAPFSYEQIVRQEHGAARELFYNLHYHGPLSSKPFGDPFSDPSALDEGQENS
jgi:hypothetical protein